MRHPLPVLCATLFAAFSITGLHAQQTVPATGGEATGSGGTTSYTVGQVAYTTNTGTNASVAQGVQQPYEISVTVGLEEAPGINLECTVYPNPATDLIKIIVTDYDTEHLYYQLYNINGKLLANEKLTSNTNIVEIQELVPTTYFIKILDDKKEVKVFRIVKH
jgi:hypothetical protein